MLLPAKFITLSLLWVICLFVPTTEATSLPKAIQFSDTAPLPKNIIMVIADGMGPSYTTGYRYFKDNPKTTELEPTVFDKHLKGLVSTHPAEKSGYVSDSAAAATALATGIKTSNDAIGVDTNQKPLVTVIDWANKAGKKIGVVTTSRINHATPAAYLTHNVNRNNYNEIADSYIDKGIEADLYLGGGWHNFIRDDRNLVEEFIQNGFQYIDNYQQLANIKKGKPVLGLFSNYGLPAAIDDNNKHRLALLTQTAIKHLSNDDGFFILVEASQIDWAGHDNDIAQAMFEMDDLAKTIEYLERFVTDSPETLVILTADHSTGGLTIGAKQEYRWEPALLHSIAHSSRYIADNIVEKGIFTRQSVNKLLNIELTDKEFQSIKEVESTFLKAKKEFDAINITSINYDETMTINYFYRRALANIIDNRTNTGWTTEGHTGVDVPLYAFGRYSNMFSGQYDNTDIANYIFKLLGKEDNKDGEIDNNL